MKIQLYTALTAYCLVALVKKTLSIQKDIYGTLRILTVPLFVKTDLKELFGEQEAKPSLQNVTELNLNSLVDTSDVEVSLLKFRI